MSLSKKEIHINKVKFGMRLRELRQTKGMSQLDLASRLNSDKTTLSRIENGRTNVTLITAIKLSVAMETPLYELFMFDISK